MYVQVLLKSDYWKKFEGTVMKQGTRNPPTHTHTHTNVHTHTY